MEKCLRRKDGSRRREHRSRSEWRTRERYRMRGGERFEHRWPPWTARLSSEERLKMWERKCLSLGVWLWVYSRKVVGEETRVKWVVLDWERKKIDWDDDNGSEFCTWWLKCPFSISYVAKLYCNFVVILMQLSDVIGCWMWWLSLRTRLTFFSLQMLRISEFFFFWIKEFLSYDVVLVQINCRS